MQSSMSLPLGSAFCAGKALTGPVRQIHPCLRQIRRGIPVLNAYVPAPSNAGSVDEVTSQLRNLLSDVSDVVEKALHPETANADYEGSCEFVFGDSRICIERDGRFVTSRDVPPTSDSQAWISSGRFSLPEACQRPDCHVSFQQRRAADGEADVAEVAWKVDGFCLARVTVRQGPAAAKSRGWCKVSLRLLFPFTHFIRS